MTRNPPPAGTPPAAPDAATADGAQALGRRGIYILPTGAGLAFLVALVVMLLGSINYGNSLGYMLTFLLGGVAFLSMLHTHRNLAGLRAFPGPAPGVHAGEIARLRLCLESARESPRPALEVTWRPPAARAAPRPWWRPRRRRPRGYAELGLAGPGIRCLELTAPAERRGRLVLGRPTLATRYPLGLFRAWAPLSFELSCLVYPRPAGARPLPAPAAGEARRDQGEGAAGQEDFSGLRGFVAGDPPRRVHWKAAARERELQVKLFAGGGPEVLHLTWEAAPGDMEARLSQLCRWVLDAHRQHRTWSLALPGAAIGPGSGPAHLERCLAALAGFGAPAEAGEKAP